MLNRDDQLERYLGALQSGCAPDEVLSEIPAEDAELVALVQLASEMRTLAHPALAPEKARAHKQRLSAAVGVWSGATRWSWQNWLPSFSLRNGLATALVVLLVGVGLLMSFVRPPGAGYAVVAESGGSVLALAPGSGEWRLLANGDRLQAGERIRTAANGRVTLAFFEGSCTELEPETDLTLTTLDGGWGGVLRVQLSQADGATDHNIVPLSGGNSFFRIDTPAGQVSVRGTQFNVAVKDGKTRVAVDAGKVLVANTFGEVSLIAGQTTSLMAAEPPGEPAYQFSLNGSIAVMQSGNWTVAGVTLPVDSAVAAGETFKAGDPVVVQGRIMQDGSLAVERVAPAAQSEESARIAGTIVDIQNETWQIGSKEVVVSTQTAMDSGLKAGEPVGVKVVVLADGRWQADEIQRLDETEEEEEATSTITPTPTLTETPTPQASETLTATPDLTATDTTLTPACSATPDGSQTPTAQVSETLTPTPAASYTLTPSSQSACQSGAEPQPEAVRLAAQYGVSADEIMKWFCQGFGFGEIDQAYALSAEIGVPVNDIFTLRSSGLGWGEIKQQLLPKPTQEPKVTKETEPSAEAKPDIETEPAEESGSTEGPKETKEPKPSKDSGEVNGAAHVPAPQPDGAPEHEQPAGAPEGHDAPEHRSPADAPGHG